MQQTGHLHTRKQSLRHSDTDIDLLGLAGELAACLLFCPGFLIEWQQSVESGGNNRGRDLLPQWTGLRKPIEVKFTTYQNELKAYLLLRPPSGAGPRMFIQFIDDCYYALVQRDGVFHVLSGWTDRQGFLLRSVENPFGLASGQLECWGVYWSNLYSLEKLPEPSHTNYALLPLRSGVMANSNLDLWWGFSATDGWVVINWQDPRNRPGSSPRYFYLLRGRDTAEVKVHFDEWSPPQYCDALQYLSTQGEPERKLLEQQLTTLRLRVEGVT